MNRVVERSITPLEEDVKATIVELAKSQHTLGAPFERVLFLTGEPPMEMAERLQPWVGDTYYQETVESDKMICLRIWRGRIDCTEYSAKSINRVS